MRFSKASKFSIVVLAIFTAKRSMEFSRPLSDFKDVLLKSTNFIFLSFFKAVISDKNLELLKSINSKSLELTNPEMFSKCNSESLR